MREDNYIPEDYKPEIAALKDLESVLKKVINIQEYEFDIWTRDNEINIYLPYGSSLPYEIFVLIKEVCDIHGVSTIVHANWGSFTFELADNPSQKKMFTYDPKYLKTFASDFASQMVPKAFSKVRVNLEKFIEDENIDDPHIIEELLTSAEERLFLSARDLGEIILKIKRIGWSARIRSIELPIRLYSLVSDKHIEDVGSLFEHWPEYVIDVLIHKCYLEDLLEVFNTPNFMVYFAPIKGRFYVTAVWRK